MKQRKLFTCLDKSHALREIGKQRQHVDSITWDEKICLPFSSPCVHGKLIALFHFALIQTRITTLQIRHASNLFLFIILFPFYFNLKRDFHIAARRCELCSVLCVCCVCVCCAAFRLAYAFCLLLLSSVCCLHTVHNVRIKLFSHYPVHSGFIKKFTMRCRSTFVGQPHTHTHIAQHILNHTHSSWHTHSHNVTDIAYHVSATFQLLHRECSLSLSLPVHNSYAALAPSRTYFGLLSMMFPPLQCFLYTFRAVRNATQPQ